METTKVYNHESENISDALGIDGEKVSLIIDHLNKTIREQNYNKVSEELAEVIRVASSPEELALIAWNMGKSNGVNNVAASFASKMLRDMMGE